MNIACKCNYLKLLHRKFSCLHKKLNLKNLARSKATSIKGSYFEMQESCRTVLFKNHKKQKEKK